MTAAIPPRRLDTPAAVADLFAAIATHPDEVCAVAYLAEDGTLLGVRHMPSRSFAVAEVPIRAIAADALVLDAAHVVMAHNHPGGDPEPNGDDIVVTRRLARALDAIGVRLHEHLVMSVSRSFSFRAAGLL